MSVIWGVIIGVFTGLVSKILVEILWRKFMRAYMKEIKRKTIMELDQVSAIIHAMRKVHLPTPDWDEHHADCLTAS